MPQTTTAINACDVSVWLDIAAGTLTEITGSGNQMDMNFDKNLGEFRSFNSRWPLRMECGKDAEFTYTAAYSTASNESVDLLTAWYFMASPDARTLKVYVPDKNVGADLYSCEVRLKSLKVPMGNKEAGPIMVTAVFVPDGEVTLTTNAT